MGIVKGDAYGHGLIPCALCLEEVGVDYFAVSRLGEALDLRTAGVRTPVLLLEDPTAEQVEICVAEDIDCTASSLPAFETIQCIAARLRRPVRLHLRFACRPGDLAMQTDRKLLEAATGSPLTVVAGVYTHFFAVGKPGPWGAGAQLKRFQSLLDPFSTQWSVHPLRHAANTEALFRLPASCLDMVRVGDALYGIGPSPEECERNRIAPVFSFRSVITKIDRIPAGTGVSYRHTWRAKQSTHIATVPVGYSDGYPRLLSGRSHVLIRGRRYPIVGTIRMHQLTVDTGDDPIAVGDEVVLIGEQGTLRIRAQQVATQAETVPSEITVSVGSRTPREYSRLGRTADTSRDLQRLDHLR
jgi:alanine racemase